MAFVLERIKTAIIRGELKPGDLLPSESEMSASLGVGKTSIREAVKMLQAVGAVDIRQGHGTVIRTEPGPDLLSPWCSSFCSRTVRRRSYLSSGNG